MSMAHFTHVPTGKNPIGCKFVLAGMGVGLIVNPIGFSRGYEKTILVLTNSRTRIVYIYICIFIFYICI